MTNQGQPVYVLIEKDADLRKVSSEIQNEAALGVDLEADSMFHYREKVCLLQISTHSQNILIDPLALEDLSPLAPVFADPSVRKVLHGADYDVRSLHRDFGIKVCSLFDTQIAARFLGFKETGLASLLKDRFGVFVEKKYQKRDWSKRPLPKDMLVYAAQDTCHLLPLARALEEELKEKRLLSCVKEECEILSKVRQAPSQGDPLFLKFKGAGKLDPRSLAVLEAILQFRDHEARRRDIPPFKILGSGPIMEMVDKKPETESDLGSIESLSQKQLKALGKGLLKKIDKALTLSEEALPVYPRKARQSISPRVAKRVKALKQWREQRANSLDIDPALVCTNAQIESIALAHPKKMRDLEGIDEVRTWQKQIFGREICVLLKTIE
jgi:ribonuclease D